MKRPAHRAGLTGNALGLYPVIPAKAGSRHHPDENWEPVRHWTPAFAGVTCFTGSAIIQTYRSLCPASIPASLSRKVSRISTDGVSSTRRATRLSPASRVSAEA